MGIAPLIGGRGSGLSPVDVRTFGAIGDGVADDTAAIQAALDEAGFAYCGPGTYLYSQLTLTSGAILMGAGRKATLLKQKPNTTGDGITLATTSTDLVGIRDMVIDGNKANQTAPNNGVKINNVNPQGSYLLLDPMFEMTNVVVRNFLGAGIYATGARGAGTFERVGAQFNQLQGFYIDSPDHTFLGCWAGSNYYAGFHMTVSSADLAYSGCHAWTNGANPALLGTDIGAGFYAAQAINVAMASCISNGNNGHGYQLDTVKNFNLASCNAGGNGFNPNYSTTGAGFWLKTPGVVTIQGQSYNYPNNTTQSYGLYLVSPNGSNTRYDILFGNGAAANLVAPIGGTNGINSTINQTIRQSGTQGIAYAASITPDPTLGDTVQVGLLTGAMTVANPAQAWTGARLTFTFQQDATGGRVVTFGSQYKTNWTPSTSANARNTITFECDGSSGSPVWIQVASAVGMPA